MNNSRTSRRSKRAIGNLCAPNPLAPWELRIGDLRVYYDVEEGPETVVLIHAVGLKERNQVHIGGEVIDL
jgi:hypothetical protein